MRSTSKHPVQQLEDHLWNLTAVRIRMAVAPTP